MFQVFLVFPTALLDFPPKNEEHAAPGQFLPVSYCTAGVYSSCTSINTAPRNSSGRIFHANYTQAAG